MDTPTTPVTTPELVTTPPMVTITPVAAEKLQGILKEKNLPGHGLRVFVSGGGCAGFQYGMAFENMMEEGDFEAARSDFKQALDAARAGAIVTGVDIAPNWLEQGRARARAEGLTIQFDEGDAEKLPYDNATFDIVVTMFGAIFAPRPERVAAELVRVCKPGGSMNSITHVESEYLEVVAVRR